MIANEGYVSLSMLYYSSYDELEEGARNYLTETSSCSLYRLCVERPNDTVRRWLFDFCKNDLFLTDGAGDPVKIDPMLIQNANFFSHHIRTILTVGTFMELGITSEIINSFNLAKFVSDKRFERFNL
jgi:hypothetical protein